jgi:hypothetical protein
MSCVETAGVIEAVDDCAVGIAGDDRRVAALQVAPNRDS